MADQGFSGVGLVNLHARTASGGKGIGRHLGNTMVVKLETDPKVVERNSSMDVNRSPLRRMTQATSANLTLTFDEHSKKNFALATRARIDEVAADTVTTINVTLETGAVVGDILSVGKTNINTLVVTDSTGAPLTLTLGTNYSADLFSGDITILDLTTGGPFVQPLKAAFKQGAVTVMAGLVLPDSENWLSLNGTNVDTGEKGVWDVYRVRFSPAAVLDFISEDYQDYELKGSCLYDSTKLASAVGGNIWKFSVPSTMQ